MPAITAIAPNLLFSTPVSTTTTAVMPYRHTISNGSRNTDRNAFHHRAIRILITTDCRTKRDRLPLSLFRASVPARYTFIPDRLLPIIISPRCRCPLGFATGSLLQISRQKFLTEIPCHMCFITISENQTSPRLFSSCPFRRWSPQMQIPAREMYRHSRSALSEYPDRAVFP